MNPNRIPLADIDAIRGDISCGIHTIQTDLQVVYGTDWVKYAPHTKGYSAINLNKYARDSGSDDYYITKFSDFCRWFEAMRSENYDGRKYKIQRIDIFADTENIPWMARRKYDIAVQYAFAARYGKDNESCVMFRYNNREPSITIKPQGGIEIASYDRTKKEGDMSGVTDRLEIRLKNLRDAGDKRLDVTDVSQIANILLGVSSKLKLLSLDEAEDAAVKDILYDIDREERDGGRMAANRKLPEVIEENEYRVLSTSEVVKLGTELGMSDTYSRKAASKLMPDEKAGGIITGRRKINKGIFNDYISILADGIERFAKG